MYAIHNLRIMVSKFPRCISIVLVGEESVKRNYMGKNIKILNMAECNLKQRPLIIIQNLLFKFYTVSDSTNCTTWPGTQAFIQEDI